MSKFRRIILCMLCFGLSGCSGADQNVQETESLIRIDETINLAAETAAETQSAEIPQTAEPQYTAIDLTQYFENINGCALFYDSQINTYQIYNDPLVNIQSSPCSTFKIISTLAGLEQGILVSSQSKMGYDGTQYTRETWNDDLELKAAFGSSCVWYFKKVIEQIEPEDMKAMLEHLGYGNCDVSDWDGSTINPSPELNGFWIESSLQISPKEWIDTLAAIFDGKTDFTEANIEILREVMYADTVNGWNIYGKTGSGYSDNGWFVGFIENSSKRHYFVLHLNEANSEGQSSGLKAKEIMLNILVDY